MAKLRLGILISGRGSNMQALIDASSAPDYPAEIALVISNEPDAAGLARAETAGIRTKVIDHRHFQDRASFEGAIHGALAEAEVNLVCLAGFMRILTAGFVERWPERVVNIHPSLLPAFKGLHVHEAVIEAGVRFSGCTVHFVTPEMDAGPIIVQAVVPVGPDDTPETLAARVLEQEHVAYPLAVRLIAEGRCRVTDGRVEIDGGLPPDGTFVNPAP